MVVTNYAFIGILLLGAIAFGVAPWLWWGWSLPGSGDG